MKNLSILFLLITFSCNQTIDNSIKEKGGTKSNPISKTENKSICTLANDPTFIEAKDTFSIYGPQTITRSMLQDKNGIYWFATWQGIISFDGKTFTNHTLKENLGRHHVLSIFEDSKHTIWFGTINGGLYCYNNLNKNNTVSSFKHFSNIDGLAGNSVMSITEDRMGNVWFGTDNGISCYNGNMFSNYFPKPDDPKNTVYCITQDYTGKLWFGTEDGIYYCHETNRKFMKESSVYFRHVLAILKDKDGCIWFGTTNGGVCKHNPSDIKNSFTYFDSKNGMNNNSVGCITQDKKGNIWFGGSVCKYDGKQFTSVKFLENQSSNNVFNIYEDQTHYLWFCTMNGVRRYVNSDFNESDKKEFTDFIAKN